MVQKSLVPPQWMLEGEAVTIRCAHGDIILYPLACVHLSIGEKISVKAAVSDILPVSVLLGTDVELYELLGQAVTMEEHTDNVVVVETRARKQGRMEEERLARECEVLSGVTPTPLVSEEIPDAHTADSADTSILTPTVTTPDTLIPLCIHQLS